MLGWEFAQISRIAWQGVETEGVVVEQRVRVGGNSRTANAPVVAFTDFEGKEHRIEARMGTFRGINRDRTTHATGQTVSVSYLPDDPQGAVIRGFRQHWIFLVGSLLCSCFSAMGFRIFRREQREMREMGW